jgi:hypothetical protein
MSDSVITPCLEASLLSNLGADDCDRELSERFLDGSERFPNGARNQHLLWQNRPPHLQQPAHRPAKTTGATNTKPRPMAGKTVTDAATRV